MPHNSSALRLLFVTPCYLPRMGGVETHVSQVAQRLIQVGVDVTVLTADATGTLPHQENIEGVPVLRAQALPRGRDWYFAPDIYRTVATGGWDIVHCQSYHTFVAPLAMLAALRARIPYVVTFHGGGSSSWWRNMIRRPQWLALRPLLARAARLIAVARFEIGLYGKYLWLPPARFTVIPNGCDIKAVMAPAPLSGALITSIGRLEQYKGHHRVIAALPKILEQRPDARVRIVGSGPFEGELHRLAQQLGVSDRVEIGAIPPDDRRSMAAILESSALVTLLSDYETHPIAVLEALAMRRPVLVADTSGLRELAERGLARSIPLNSLPEQISAAIIDQLRHPLVPERIDLPSWDACARDLLDVYRSIISYS